MQTQDAPAEFLFKLWPWFEANRNRIIAGVAALLVVAGAYSFYSWYHGQRETAAGQALTLALVNASKADASKLAVTFEQLAAKYSGTVAGGRAQLQAASTLFDAGHYAEAQVQFQKYASANSSGSLSAIAQLGLAASLEAQNKLNEAAAAYRKVAGQSAEASAQLTAKFSLGRIAELSGKPADAVSYYQEVSRSSLAGSLATEAAMRAMEIKTRMAAAPKAAAKS
jgi:predicted negative regulator of RcsB-dependent stress response